MVLERQLVPLQLAPHVCQVVVDGFPGLQGDVGVVQKEALGGSGEVPLRLSVIPGVVEYHGNLLQEDGIVGG